MSANTIKMLTEAEAELWATICAAKGDVPESLLVAQPNIVLALGTEGIYPRY